jgi:hypothetical protein
MHLRDLLLDSSEMMQESLLIQQLSNVDSELDIPTVEGLRDNPKTVRFVGGLCHAAPYAVAVS